MARFDSFTFRVDDEERRLIARLSEYLQRNQSDAVRLIIRQAVRTIEAETPQPLFGKGDDADADR